MRSRLIRGRLMGPSPKVCPLTLPAKLAVTPLVKNLDHPDYLEIILDGCNTLEERFERIDSRRGLERLEANKKK
jgi:hypothetical protein